MNQYKVRHFHDSNQLVTRVELLKIHDEGYDLIKRYSYGHKETDIPRVSKAMSFNRAAFEFFRINQLPKARELPTILV